MHFLPWPLVKCSIHLVPPGPLLLLPQAAPALSHTLFRISSNSDCRYGERVILSRYLGDTHSFHHLITTQVPVKADDRYIRET